MNGASVANTFHLTFVANSLVSPKSIGGGDRIFLEFARYWHSPATPVEILACEEGVAVCRDNLPKTNKVTTLSRFSVARYGLVGAYVRRIIAGWRKLLRLDGLGLIYSTSDFLPDVVVAFRAKQRNPQLTWLAGLYLVAPNPLKDARWRSIRSVLSWINQQISILLIRRSADHVFVLSDHDRMYLARKGVAQRRMTVIQGGIDLHAIAKVRPNPRKYEGCFVGRFHPQKGVGDLLRIWEHVQQSIPGARLAIIGWEIPEIVEDLRAHIRRMNLSAVMDMLGFLDGATKWRVIKSSKILLFPSHYESFGITALEALACGTPVVAYDLPIFRHTFGRGLVKVPLKDVDTFAQHVVTLLESPARRQKLSLVGKNIAREYDWARIAVFAWRAIEPLTKKEKFSTSRKIETSATLSLG